MQPARIRVLNVRRCISGVLFAAATWAIAGSASAGDFDYRLAPIEVASDTWVFVGRNEDMTAANGGNVANTAFVITSEGVVVIDSGPTRRYAEQVRAAIHRKTIRPVVRVFNTHHHGDHVLGNIAYPDLVEGLPATIASMRVETPDALAEILRVSPDAAAGTEIAVPTRQASGGRFRLGSHEFELIATKGHTGGDLVLFDHTTGVLFAGDLMFNARAPTFANADIDEWIDALNRLEGLRLRMLVPGHGAPTRNAQPLRETRDYLLWLSGRLERSAADGMAMADVLAMPPPERFRGLALIDAEYLRTVRQLYPAMAATQRDTTGDTR
ncbi:MAG: quinoprotein relay system zinc metallohydrolase 1 [Betaproteobacteria bacterium]